MRNIIFGIIITIVTLFAFRYLDTKKNDQVTLVQNSTLIEKQIKQVGKLVVTEGHFSQIYNYKASKAIFGDYFKSNKKALVMVNADVSIGYDLSKIEFNIDKPNKTLRILSVPEPDVKVYPNLEYYDIQSDYLNPFEANDYNIIKKNITEALHAKIEASSLKSNAKNRLISELAKFYILTNSLGWRLQYNNTPILETNDFYKELFK